MLQVEPVLEEDRPDEPPGGDEEAGSWKSTNNTTYPLGGCGTDSSLGTFHSTASVSGGSCPASTRRRNIKRDTLDRVQFNMTAANFRADLRCEL
jgi:hypothetical protein